MTVQFQLIRTISPLNDVAVTIPVTSIPCEFAVTAEPTTIDP